MPELPEVETIRLGLLNKILGKKIVNIKIFEKKSFVGSKKKVINQEIINVWRRGKLLRILLENGFELQIHLKMSGQLLFYEDDKEKPKYTRIVFVFNDKSKLFFADQRKFGMVKVVDHKKFNDSDFGIEPLTKDFTLKNFERVVLKSFKPIKTLLIDQKQIAGLGNIYASEILFQAKVNPFKIAKKLTRNEIDSLFKGIENIISRAIALKGSTMKDEKYVQLNGEAGGYQKQFLVYERDGEECFECGEKIKRKKQNGRSTYYCPNCQK